MAEENQAQQGPAGPVVPTEPKRVTTRSRSR